VLSVKAPALEATPEIAAEDVFAKPVETIHGPGGEEEPHPLEPVAAGEFGQSELEPDVASEPALSDLQPVAAINQDGIEPILPIETTSQFEPMEAIEPAPSEFKPAYKDDLELEKQAAQAFAPPLLELPADDKVAAEVLEFFVPEMEEHLQAVTESLLSLEANPNPKDINKLFRAMHTIKGSAAQVGFHRLSAIAHRAEDLIARLRDGELKPSANIVDLCLESTF